MLVVLCFIVAINCLLGLLILVRNHKAAANVLFFTLAFCTALWSVASYLTDNGPAGEKLLWGRLAFVFPILVTLSLAFLVRVFPVGLKTAKRAMLLVSGLAAAGIVISMSTLVIRSAVFQPHKTTLKPGSLYPVFLLIELVLFAYCTVSYYVSRRRSNALQRSQSTIVAVGMLLSFMWALVFNALLPLYVQSWNTADLGPMGTVMFVSLTAYAIIRHHLFDIRLVAARSAAYFLAIGTIALGYLGVVFAVGNLFFSDQHVGIQYELVSVAIAVFVGLTFQPIKQLFDHLTDSIFFRDHYNAQELLDGLNRLFVTEKDLRRMLGQAAAMMGDSLKAEFAFFNIETDPKKPPELVGTTGIDRSFSDLQTIWSEVARNGQQIILTDTIGSDLPALRTVLQAHNIAVLVCLNGTVHKSGGSLAYLAFGHRRSGNRYTANDLRLLDLIANELVIAIQNMLQFEEIQRFTVTLQEKVNAATHQLRRSNDKLRELDEAKDDFVSMASHQLRTPLTSVKGYLSLVLDGDAGKITKQQRELLNQAFASSQRMVYLIADLLNVSRLKTGKFVIENSAVNLADVIEEEIGQLQDLAKTKKQTLTFTKPASFPELLLDDTKIRQVVMNFTDNALHYTPAGGTITVSLTETPASVEMRVADNGIGVPRTEVPHLFTKLYRAGNARKMRPDGTGLGLFMAKKVIVAQGGSVIFSTEEDKGSTFGFSFPKSLAVSTSTSVDKKSVK